MINGYDDPEETTTEAPAEPETTEAPAEAPATESAS